MSDLNALDRVLPRYTFRHEHAVWVHSGDPGRVMDVVRDAPLGQSWWITILFRLRGLPSPAGGSRAFVRAMGWSVLESGEPLEYVVCYLHPSTCSPVEDVENADTFRAKSAERKVAFAFAARSIAPDIVELRTETRVLCGDRRQTVLFGWYWMAIRPFSVLIRLQILRLVRNAAEAEWRRTPQARRDAAVEVVARLPSAPLALLRAVFRTLGSFFPALAVAALGRLMMRVPRRPLRVEEDRFLASGQQRKLAFGSETLTGYAFGSGPTVVLVHGLLGSAADFRRLVPAVVAAGFTALAVDWTNHGRSPSGPALARDSISNLAKLLAAIPDLHAVIGHSAGAYLSLLALDRMSPATPPFVVLLSAPTSIGVPIRATMRYLSVPKPLYCQMCAWFSRQLDVSLAVPAARCPDMQGAVASRLLCVHDPADPYAPYHDIERLVASDSRASLLPRPNAGHFKLLLDAATVSAVCRFIEQ